MSKKFAYVNFDNFITLAVAVGEGEGEFEVKKIITYVNYPLDFYELPQWNDYFSEDAL